MQDRVLSLLGLAEKAGKVGSGGFAAEEALKKHRASLLILSEDAQKNTQKNFTDMCTWQKVPLRYYGTREVLGHAVGKESRSCIAVTDTGFAESILKLLDSGKQERGCNGKNENQ